MSAATPAKENSALRRRRTRAELQRLFGAALALGAAGMVVLLAVMFTLSAFFDFFAAVFTLQRLGASRIELIRATLALGLLGGGCGLVAVGAAALAAWRGRGWPLVFVLLAMPPVVVAVLVEGLSPWPFATMAFLAAVSFAGALLGLAARPPRRD